MTKRATAAGDPMQGRPIRCEIELDGAGVVTLLRSTGCTADDARDLCRLVGDADPAVLDRTGLCRGAEPTFPGCAATAGGHQAGVPPQPPVLSVDMLTADTGSVPVADRELVGDVLEVLDSVDRYTATDQLGVAAYWAPGVTAAMRAVLDPHRADRDGRCAGCPPPATPWPCPLWRTAHRWMVELDPATGRRRDDDWDYVVA